MEEQDAQLERIDVVVEVSELSGQFGLLKLWVIVAVELHNSLLDVAPSFLHTLEDERYVWTLGVVQASPSLGCA